MAGVQVAWRVLASGLKMACVAMAALATFTMVSTAHAASDDDDESSWYEGTSTNATAAKETWAHVFATRKIWSLTNGTTWAPSTNLQQDGVRLRLVSGLSGFRYTTRQHSVVTGDAITVEHHGYARTIDLLAGYQWSVGAWTLKAFAGYHSASGMRTPDPEIAHKLSATGARGVFEAWFNHSDKTWASLDVGYTTVKSAYATRLRMAWKPAANWSIGPEAQAIGNEDGRGQRLGAFLRFDNGWHELSAAIGYDRSSGQGTAPYASVQYMLRF